MRATPCTLFCLVLGCPIVAAATDALQASQARQENARDISRWLAEACEEADGPLPLSESRVVWRTEYVELPSPQELATLRAEVGGRQDHPDLQRLAQYESVLRGKPPAVTSTLWYGGPGYWRFNTDELDRGIVGDTVSTPHRSWRLSSSRPKSAMLLLRPAGDLFAAGGAAKGDEQVFMGELTRFLDGGLRFVAGWDRTGLSVQGREWVAEFGPRLNRAAGDRKPLFQVKISGDWSPELGRGFVREYITTITPSGVRGDRFMFEGWARSPALNRWVAGTVRRSDPQERPKVVYRWMVAEREEAGLLARITEPPKFGEPDRVRTDLVVTAIDDRAAGKLVTARNGERVELPMGAGPAGSSTLRVWGWGIGIVIVSFAGALAWVWRRRSIA